LMKKFYLWMNVYIFLFLDSSSWDFVLQTDIRSIVLSFNKPYILQKYIFYLSRAMASVRLVANESRMLFSG
jgi:hypothetical protein